MQRHYKAAPIVEALCDFRFDERGPWDQTVRSCSFTNVYFDKKNLVQVGSNW